MKKVVTNVCSFFSGEMAAPLPNPLSDSDTPDFLAFSAASTSTPRQERFKPKRGKQNRQDNWRQFGRFEDRSQNRSQPSTPQNSSYFYSSTPNWTQSPSPRGWPGGFRGSPGGFRGSPGGFRGQPGGFRGQRGNHFSPQGHFNQRRGGRPNHHQQNSSGSYFHPSMIEDPWKDLMPAENQLSDSLQPQVGDSIIAAINPAPDVPDSLSNTQEMSTYSFNADSTVKETSELANVSDLSKGDIEANGLSDSMIPLVGDSILSRNTTD